MVDTFHASLKDGYRELNALYEDVNWPVVFRQDWELGVIARRFLGPEVRVHAWRLAEYYLLAWTDWGGTVQRYLRYFGHSWEDLPNSWHSLRSRCEALTIRMFDDAALGQLISSSWRGPDSLAPPEWSNRTAGPDAVAQEIVVNHRRLCLITGQAMTTTKAGVVLSQSQMARHPWDDAMQFASRNNGVLVRSWTDLPDRDRSEVFSQLRHYQRIHLLASWLLDGESLDKGHPTTALLKILHKELSMPSWIDQVLEQLKADTHDRQIARNVLTRIANAVSEFSYENVVNDVSQETFRGGPDSPIGSEDIDLIPSRFRTGCHSVLVAFSKGEKKKIGFTSIMREVREHLIDCFGTTRIVIVLCDTWTRSILEEHLRDLRAHYRRKVRFVFLQAVNPGTTLVPLPVDLSDIS
jgi:hypothetical protein